MDAAFGRDPFCNQTVAIRLDSALAKAVSRSLIRFGGLCKLLLLAALPNEMRNS